MVYYQVGAFYGKEKNMRRNLTITAVCTALALQFPLFADVVNPDYHPVGRCATIDNLDSFPDIVIIAAVYAPGAYLLNQYVVKKDSCITMGYKFNGLKLYWTTLEYFNQVGISGVGIPQSLAKKAAGAAPAPATALPNSVEPYGGTVPNTNPLVWEQYHYLLYYQNSALNVYLAKKVSVNSDSTRSILTFDPPASGVIRPVPRVLEGPNRATLAVSRGYAVLTSSADGPAFVTFFNCAGRPAVSFSKNCRRGCTYFHAIPGLASGVYWIRLTTPDGTVSRQQPFFR
jgi:hypothetical protein